MNKTRYSLVLIAAFLALTVATSAGLAVATADPQLAWWVVAGGGGRSSGGDFQVEGSAGQAAAGLMRGGSYELGSGFWGSGVLTRAVYGIHLPVVVRGQ